MTDAASSEDYLGKVFHALTDWGDFSCGTQLSQTNFGDINAYLPVVTLPAECRFVERLLNFRKVFSNLCKVRSGAGNKAGVSRH